MGSRRYSRVRLCAADFRTYDHLSFRAAQIPRHPHTLSSIGDLKFKVELEDGSGTTSAIKIQAYKGGIDDPYGRKHFNEPAENDLGWAMEFETIRIRLTDFTHDAGAALNLSDISTVRFLFGGTAGPNKGALAIDQVEVLND